MNSFATFPFDSIFSIKFCIYWYPLRIFAQIFLFVSFWHCLQTLKPKTSTNQRSLLIMCLKIPPYQVWGAPFCQKRSKSQYPNIHRHDYIELVMHGHCNQDTYICICFIYIRGRVSRPLSNHNLRFEVGFSPPWWWARPPTHTSEGRVHTVHTHHNDDTASVGVWLWLPAICHFFWTRIVSSPSFAREMSLCLRRFDMSQMT
jgi:hypothetical protein